MKYLGSLYKCISAILMAALLLMLFNACDGFQVSDNGNLDGMWHLVEVDSLDNNVSADFTYSGIYWSVQSDLLALDDKLFRYESCLMRFSCKDSRLRLFDPYLNNRDEGDITISDVAKLSPFGINALDEAFAVETLTRKKMVLKSQSLRLTFKKN